MTGRIPCPLLAVFALTASAWAGSLTPPEGPPVPTMKTLSDVEPRIAIESLAGNPDTLHLITEPGSYVLGRSLAGEPARAAIWVAADYVTIDLGGFTLQGTTGQSGIVLAGPRRGIVVRNGTLRGWGRSALQGDECSGCVAERLLVQDNGSDGSYSAIRLGELSRIVDCSAILNPNWTGIQVGSGSMVSGSTSNANVRGYELSGDANVIVRSHAVGNSEGIYMQASGLLTGCTATSNNMGLRAGSNGVIRENTAWGNAIGIHTDGEDVLVESNHVKNNGDWGLHTSIVMGGVVLRHNRAVGNNLAINTDASGVNLVYGNTLAGNVTDIFGGGAYGIVLDFSAGMVITGGSPWANLRY